jgi:ubiquinone/menaquinone biosynthesis C-methylase UbiE
MADHFQTIYAHSAASYDALVSYEDYQGHLLPALTAIRPLAGLDIVECGAGTGRLTRLLAPHVRSIRAYDASPHMLATAHNSLTAIGSRNWMLGIADNRALPEAARSADLVLEGWSFGHAIGWHPDTWRDEIGRMLAEMARILRPGGTAILLETLGTGSETPAPPTPGLAEFYEWLVAEHDFEHTWIRTDYQFSTVPEAAELTRFFFGGALADRIKHEQLLILPECTGFWWKRF